MEHRRHFLSMLTALGAAGTVLRAAETPQPTRTAGVVPLPAPFDKQSANFVELYIKPGQHSMAHKHPGFVLGYVIEGELRFQVAGEPERILHAGEIFFEPPGATHLKAESASTDKPVRVLAIVVADSDKKQLIEPA